jgi:hypothetical protein
MGRQKSGKSKSSQPSTAEAEKQQTPDLSKWTDEAAKARTLDDSRLIPPRDPTGLPSSGARYVEDPHDQ